MVGEESRGTVGLGVISDALAAIANGTPQGVYTFPRSVGIVSVLGCMGYTFRGLNPAFIYDKRHILGEINKEGRITINHTPYDGTSSDETSNEKLEATLYLAEFLRSNEEPFEEVGEEEAIESLDKQKKGLQEQVSYREGLIARLTQQNPQ